MSNLWETHAGLFEDAEQIVLTDESPVTYERQEPTFYARVPKLAIMSLDPYELALYTHYKQTASDHGYCNKSNATLAREAKMSVSKVKAARQRLLKQGFITVEYIPDESGIINTPPTIKIVDIWQKNHDTYSEGVVTKKQGGGYQETTPSYQETPKKNLYKKNLSKKDSLPRASRGEFTASKFYLVADEKHVIFIKPYKQADAQAECERLKEYGVIAVKGSTLNDEAVGYASYERRKPQRPRDVTFDAFGEGAFNLPSNFDTSNIGKDGGRIGKLVSQLASHLDRTFNDIVNDATVAARVKSYYQWRKTDERYKHLSARDPLIFLGEWQDFETWEKAQSNGHTPKPTQQGKPANWTAEDDARVEAQYAESNRRLEEWKRQQKREGNKTS